MKSGMHLGWGIVLAVAMVGCGGGDTPSAAGPVALTDDSPVLGETGPYTVTETDVEVFISQFPERSQERHRSRDGQVRIVERLTLNKMLFAEAESRGLLNDPTVVKQAEVQWRNSVIQALMKDLRAEATTAEALQAYYNSNPAEFQQETIRARHVLVGTEAEAVAVREQIVGGADFEEVARELSQDPSSKVRGGDLGFFTRDRMVEAFSTAAFALEIGQVSEPVQSRFGWHVIRVEEKRAEIPFESVEERIRRTQNRESVDTFLDELRGQMDIQLRGRLAGPPPPIPEGGEEPTPESGHHGAEGHGFHQH